VNVRIQREKRSYLSGLAECSANDEFRLKGMVYLKSLLIEMKRSSMKRVLFIGMVLIGQYSYTQVRNTTMGTSNTWIGAYSLEPQFVGGIDSLNAYLESNLFAKKSLDFQEDGLRGGKVVVRFVVEVDGSVSHPVLETTLLNCEPCNEEAIRVVMSMPNWIPVSNSGKTERAFVRLPILFEF
jgi:protein TonB